MLDIASVANDIDGETVFSGSSKHVDSAAFKRRPRELRIPATFFESADLAQIARAGSHTESFIKSVQKKLFLKSDRNFFRLTSAGFKQNGVLELIQHLTRLSRRRRKWRTHQAGLVTGASIAALPSHPVTGHNSPGRYDLCFFCPKFDDGYHDFPPGHFD